MRFDTLDKKPKVWNIAILTVIMVGLMMVLSLIGGERCLVWQLILFDAYLLGVIILLCGPLHQYMAEPAERREQDGGRLVLTGTGFQRILFSP